MEWYYRLLIASLGLDFKAVIICGLYTLSTYNYEDKEGNLKTKKVGSKYNTN